MAKDKDKNFFGESQGVEDASTYQALATLSEDQLIFLAQNGVQPSDIDAVISNLGLKATMEVRQLVEARIKEFEPKAQEQQRQQTEELQKDAKETEGRKATASEGIGGVLGALGDDLGAIRKDMGEEKAGINAAEPPPPPEKSKEGPDMDYFRRMSETGKKGDK